MENKDLTPMEFDSSNGLLLVNENGSIHKDSDIEGWLTDISKVDLEELDNYYKLQGIGLCEGGDVLDFGWWDKNGEYNKPDRLWRIEVFHNQEIKNSKVASIVDNSYEWINKNRLLHN